MKKLQLAIIPGILIFSVLLFGLAELIFSKQVPVQAKDQSSGDFRVPEEKMAVDQCGLHSNYPASILQWCSEIEQVSLSVGVDSNIIAAVMLQESGGDPNIISSSGAVGLLQVMPRDGKAAEFMCMNGPCFSNRPFTEQLLDPLFNLQYGTKFLASLISQTGNLKDALMRYGPYNVGYYYADKVLRIIDLYDS